MNNKLVLMDSISFHWYCSNSFLIISLLFPCCSCCFPIVSPFVPDYFPIIFLVLYFLTISLLFPYYFPIISLLFSIFPCYFMIISILFPCYFPIISISSHDLSLISVQFRYSFLIIYRLCCRLIFPAMISQTCVS
jgi:hypothetical protein